MYKAVSLNTSSEIRSGKIRGIIFIIKREVKIGCDTTIGFEKLYRGEQFAAKAESHYSRVGIG